MQLKLTDNVKQELTRAAHFCGLPAEKLAQLFVEDGLTLYLRDPDEFRGTITDGETE